MKLMPDSLLLLLQVLLGFSVLVGTSAWVDLLVCYFAHFTKTVSVEVVTLGLYLGFGLFGPLVTQVRNQGCPGIWEY